MKKAKDIENLVESRISNKDLLHCCTVTCHETSVCWANLAHEPKDVVELIIGCPLNLMVSLILLLGLRKKVNIPTVSYLAIDFNPRVDYQLISRFNSVSIPVYIYHKFFPNISDSVVLHFHFIHACSIFIEQFGPTASNTPP